MYNKTDYKINQNQDNIKIIIYKNFFYRYFKHLKFKIGISIKFDI